MKNGFKNLAVFVVSLALSLGGLYFGEKSFLKSAYPCHYEEFVTKYSEKYGVDKWLVFSVIRTESGFKNNAISEADAKGLMQITKETYEWAQQRKNLPYALSHDTLYNPETAIDFGSYILSLLISEFSSEETSMAAYHAGWGNVKSWLKNESYSKDGKTLFDIPFPETKKYVKKVMKTKEIYQRLWG